MKKITKISLAVFITTLFLVSTFGLIPATAVSNNFPGSPAESVAGSYYAYNPNYLTTDNFISGTTLNASGALRQTLDQTGTKIQLSSVTPESDNIALGSTGVNLYDRPAYSKTMLNDTANSATYTAANATVAGLAVSNHATSQTMSVTNKLGYTTVNQETVFGFDLTNNGAYTDAGDLNYLPLNPSSTVLWAGVQTTWGASPNAGDYWQTQFNFTTTTGTDYMFVIDMHATTGTNGWTNVGSTADHEAIFNIYSASGVFNAIQFNIGTLFSKDSSETGTIIGLHLINEKCYMVGASDSASFKATGFGLFNNYVALTSNSDVQKTFNIDGASNLPIFDTADDLLSTSYTASSATSTVSLLNDLTGAITLKENIRYIEFTGVFTIQPTSTSTISSTQVTGQSYYLTTLNLNFDSRGLASLITYANVYSITSVNFNFTVDDSVLPFTTRYQDNLYQATAGDYAPALTVNGIQKGNTWEIGWAASTVSGSASPKTQVQYTMTTFSATQYSTDTLVAKIYTKIGYSGAISSSVVTGAGGPVIASSSSSSSNMNFYILAGIVGALIVGVLVIRSRGMKKKYRRRR